MSLGSPVLSHLRGRASKDPHIFESLASFLSPLTKLVRSQTTPTKPPIGTMRSLIAFVRQRVRSSSEKDTTATAVNKDDEAKEADRPPAHSKDQSPRREFPSSGFDLVDHTVKLEEEAWSWYSAKRFYPITIGEVLNNTYQVVAKLGYGTASTTWLCRDLQNHRYVTLKVYASNSPQTSREVTALEHVRSILAERGSDKHIGATNIRTLIKQFRVSHPGSSRTNLCLVFNPLGWTVADIRKLVYGGRMDMNMVRCIAFYMLQALDFLHREANLVHGGTFSVQQLRPARIQHRILIRWRFKMSKRITSCSP